MGTADGALADLQRRREDALDAELLEGQADADDVGDRVDRADLVEVHRLDRDAMHRRLGLAQTAEDARGAFAGPRRGRHALDQGQDLAEAAVVVVRRGRGRRGGARRGFMGMVVTRLVRVVVAIPVVMRVRVIMTVIGVVVTRLVWMRVVVTMAMVMRVRVGVSGHARAAVGYGAAVEDLDIAADNLLAAGAAFEANIDLAEAGGAQRPDDFAGVGAEVDQGREDHIPRGTGDGVQTDSSAHHAVSRSWRIQTLGHRRRP